MPAQTALFPMSLKRILLTSALAVATVTSSTDAMAGLGFAPGPAGWDYYSSQNLLIGATQTLQQSANYGQNITVATMDTGVESSWVGFGGLNISSISCLNNACAPTIANSDDNGHGTFVASEIVGGVQFNGGNGMLGVAPLANLMAVKVLDAQGSGNSNDVANGIKYAVNNGAQVINLSLGPTGTPAQQVAFYNSLASAINYAASKNAVIVFAGGNSGNAFVGGANIGSSTQKNAPNLFTDAALQRMFFMGSTNSQEVWNWYSAVPGSAGFYSGTGKFYAYKSMWLMADGGGITGNGQCIDCIVGAPNVVNASYLKLSAGTSMAAPQGAGAAALLAARWPQLITKGTIATILEQTATPLSTINNGHVFGNTFYGNGFINLAQAFQPVGGLSVINNGGTYVSVGGVTSTVLTSGALGSMSKLSTALSNFTAFDSFQRDFAVNLSGLVSTKHSSSPVSQSVGAPSLSSSATHFADGSSLSFGNISSDSPMIDHPANNNDTKGWFVSFTDAAGTTMAAGSGVSASASFAGAMWGNDTPLSASISEPLLNLTQGGNFVAFGNQLSGNTRMALSWSNTQSDSGTTSDWTKPDATSFGSGISTQLSDNWKGGVTFGMLNEQSGLLGTTYAVNGPLSLGNTNHSMSMGLSSVFTLGDKRELLVDAAVVRSNGAQGDGVITSISPLYARSFGAALVERDAIGNGDNLSLSVRSPLRVFSGSATLATSSVDGNGNPVIGTQRVGLTPSGNELDFGVTYAAPVAENMSWNVSVDARRNVDNIAGNNDADILIGTKIRF